MKNKCMLVVILLILSGTAFAKNSAATYFL